MYSLEQETIAAELAGIQSPEELKAILYNVGQFYKLSFFGHKMRIERRRLRTADLRAPLGTIGMAALMSIAFAVDRSLIGTFVSTMPFFSGAILVCLMAASYRKVRLSDWYMLFYVASYIITAALLFPVLMMNPSDVNGFLAAATVFSVSLAIFLNISTFFYVLMANIRPPEPTARWHEIGA